jgi:dTDP-4-dehydrorhamnose reductase
MKILLTGGSGLLGRNLIRHLRVKGHEIIAPNSSELDITDPLFFILFDCDLVIHCAAIAKFADAEKNPIDTIETNIQGTCNALKHAMSKNARFVFISSSHVFDGQKGNYTHTDLPNPLTRYAKSKVAGEMATLIYEKSLVIRTEFCDVDFPFDTAFTDKYSSKEYIDIIAPKIAEKCLSEQTGICHVGGPRRSFYEFGQLRNPNVKPGSVENLLKTSTVPILIDTSLIEN